MSTTVTPSASPVSSGNAGRVVRFLATRLGLSLITLWLLSVIVFAGGQLLPGDIGRAVLGPLADARAVAALNHQLGADRPLMTQYVEWISHFVRGDMGLSYAYREPVGPFVADALAHFDAISAGGRAYRERGSDDGNTTVFSGHARFTGDLRDAQFTGRSCTATGGGRAGECAVVGRDTLLVTVLTLRPPDGAVPDLAALVRSMREV